MTRSRRSPSPVPLQPTHRRSWRTFWLRCTCGLTAPCVDRAVPPKERPFPPRQSGVAIGRAPCHTDSRSRPHPRSQAASTSRPDSPDHTESRSRPESRSHTETRSHTKSRSYTESWSHTDSRDVLAGSRMAQPIRAPFPSRMGSHGSMEVRDGRVESRGRIGAALHNGVPFHSDARIRSDARGSGAQAGRAGRLTPAQAHRASPTCSTGGDRQRRDVLSPTGSRPSRQQALPPDGNNSTVSGGRR